MLRIPCPWCGLRDETEFLYGGEAQVQRPATPASADDSAWAEYLFYRSNAKGPYLERWVHEQGCRQWFNAVRDTVSHHFLAVYMVGESPPEA